MNYTEFKNRAQTHLSEWIRTFYPEIKEGVYMYNSKEVQHTHILPLGRGKQKDAIIEAIRKYNVLTDGVELNLNVFPKKELHILAHHLTSSQLLCYNFFSIFLKNEMSANRIINITSELREWVRKSFPDIPFVSEYAKCEFEYKFNDDEGTSFDFCIMDDNVSILFEIKYTENGFGKAKDDKRHNDKFDAVYKELIKKQNTVSKKVEPNVFFNSYQLFRNAIRTSDNVYSVVIYPRDNEICSEEFYNFKSSEWIENENRKRLMNITWEEAFSNSVLTAHSGLRRKYNL